MSTEDPRSTTAARASTFATTQDPHGGAFDATRQPTRPPKPPLSLFTSARRIVTYCAAFITFGVASALVGAATGPMVGSLISAGGDADFTFYAMATMAASLVLFLGGLWWWIDARMLRRGTPAALRALWTVLLWTGTVSFVGTSVLVIILLTVVFGNPEGLAWMGSFFVTIVVMSCAAIPAVIAGELVGGTPPHGTRDSANVRPHPQ